MDYLIFFFSKVKQKIVDGTDFQRGYRNNVQNLERCKYQRYAEERKNRNEILRQKIIRSLNEKVNFFASFYIPCPFTTCVIIAFHRFLSFVALGIFCLSLNIYRSLLGRLLDLSFCFSCHKYILWVSNSRGLLSSIVCPSISN